MPETLPELPDLVQLFEELPCGVLITSIRGTILQANRTICEWLGMLPIELVQRHKIQELFSMGGRIFHQTHWVPMLQMQGSLAEVKFEVLHKDGRHLPMMLNAVRRQGAAGSYDVITLTMAEERNKYERELLLARNRADELVLHEREAQKVIEAAQSRLLQAVRVGAMYLWDVHPETGQRSYDPEVATLLGYTQPRSVDEQTFLGAVVAEDVDAESTAFETALREPVRVHSWTHRIEGVDGVQRVVAVSGQAFLNKDGSLSQFVGVLSDITESVRRRAVAEDRALFAEQMVAIVSHDLRNPLSAILTSTSVVALGDELSDLRARALDRIVRSTERARRLIDDLLDFTLARLGSGLSVTRRSVDLHQLTSRIVDDLGPAFPGRRLRHIGLGRGAASADPDRIAQLLGNLVGNAMNYGEPGSEVTVTSELVGNLAKLTVHNDGNPIPPALLASIFEPMVRGDTGNSAARSVGLGLFIVRAIATAHGGAVSVTSSAKSGTAFELAFPALAQTAVD